GALRRRGSSASLRARRRQPAAARGGGLRAEVRCPRRDGGLRAHHGRSAHRPHPPRGKPRGPGRGDGSVNPPAVDLASAEAVADRAGAVVPFDASMMVVAMMKEHPLPRWPRFLVLNWAFELPFLSTFMRRVGGVPASPHNAEQLLEQDRLVMVFPEGVKGTG